MAAAEPRLRSDPAGGAEIWYRGWKLTFTADDDAPPEVKKEEAPPDAAPAGAKVKIDDTDLRYGDWIAGFDSEGKQAPRVRQAKPPKTGIPQRFFRYLRRR